VVRWAPHVPVRNSIQLANWGESGDAGAQWPPISSRDAPRRAMFVARLCLKMWESTYHVGRPHQSSLKRYPTPYRVSIISNAVSTDRNFMRSRLMWLSMVRSST
jgi:hypothetical protein